MRYFEVKTIYECAGEKGLNTKVKEVYLCENETFAGAEFEVTRALQPLVTGSFVIEKIEAKAYSDIIENLDMDADRWYKCKVALITIDEATAKEKNLNRYFLVKACCADSAIKCVGKYMSGSVMDYEVVMVAESAIVDILKSEEI